MIVQILNGHLIVNVSQLWRQTNNKKSGLNKMPSDNKENYILGAK